MFQSRLGGKWIAFLAVSLCVSLAFAAETFQQSEPVFDASRNPRLNRPIPAITVLRIRRINNQGADSVDVAI